MKLADAPYWVALSRVTELGAKRIRLLFDYFNSAEKAFKASEEELFASGLPARAVNAVLQDRKTINPEREWERLESLGIQVVTLADGNYPTLLSQIYDPPVVLFYRGELNITGEPGLAVVGSRKATEYGKTVANKLAFDLAGAGVAVISGMARGIDTSAHFGALQAGGKTVAVLGCGLDICYPPENRKLRDDIVRSGLLLSEFPPGTMPKPHHFPMRNRIISGLSLATIVVEAAEKSGALITADCALEQGRDVFAVPGSINSPNSRGCHKLIKEGAAMVEHAADILSELGFLNVQYEERQSAALTPVQKKILQAIEFEPVQFDDLVERSGLDAQVLAVALVELELTSFLKKLPGNYFLRV
ncbi:MAG: DNA-processing protein DprA [Clostridiales bacterium]|jgi:DNA processing protein|nr:DNA-processing protein DprA [Clostridiales bacterium]